MYIYVQILNCRNYVAQQNISDRVLFYSSLIERFIC